MYCPFKHPFVLNAGADHFRLSVNRDPTDFSVRDIRSKTIERTCYP